MRPHTQTRTNLENADDECSVDDVWGGVANDRRSLSDSELWTGATRFGKLLRVRPGNEVSSGRVTMTQKTLRLGDVWPEIWDIMNAT